MFFYEKKLKQNKKKKLWQILRGRCCGPTKQPKTELISFQVNISDDANYEKDLRAMYGFILTFNI